MPMTTRSSMRVKALRFLFMGHFIGTTAGSDPVTTSGTSLAAPDSTGRGTGTIVVSSPSSTFKIIYYLIDDNTALFLDQDTTPIAIGVVLRQF